MVKGLICMQRVNVQHLKYNNPLNLKSKRLLHTLMLQRLNDMNPIGNLRQNLKSCLRLIWWSLRSFPVEDKETLHSLDVQSWWTIIHQKRAADFKILSFLLPNFFFNVSLPWIQIKHIQLCGSFPTNPEWIQEAWTLLWGTVNIFYVVLQQHSTDGIVKNLIK